MNIGVDLDNTIIQTDKFILNDLNKYYNSSYVLEDIVMPRIEKALNLDVKIVSKFINLALGLTHLIKPLDGIPYYFNRISSTNNVSIISRRSPELYGITKMSLDKLGVRDYLLYLTLGKKSDILRAKDIEVMVEDNLEEVADIYNNNCECIVLLMNRYWNKGFVGSSNIKRVKNWEEIYATITSIQSSKLGN